MENKWNIYIGIAVEDRIFNSKFLKVYCHNMLPFMDGKIKDFTVKDIIKIIDDTTNTEETIEVKSTNIIIAAYFDLFYNTSFPPFIRKGQRVLLLQQDDDDKYYWIPLGMDKHLNKQEVVRIFASDKETDEIPNDSNSYFVEIDTLLKKRIIIKTSKSDDEDFVYSIIIDSKNNKIHINDDDGREITLDSDNDSISFKTKKNMRVILEKDMLKIHAPNSILLKADNDITFQAGSRITYQAPKIRYNEG